MRYQRPRPGPASSRRVVLLVASCLVLAVGLFAGYVWLDDSRARQRRELEDIDRRSRQLEQKIKDAVTDARD